MKGGCEEVRRCFDECMERCLDEEGENAWSWCEYDCSSGCGDPGWYCSGDEEEDDDWSDVEDEWWETEEDEW